MATQTFRNISVGTPTGNDEYVDVPVAREYDSTRTYARGAYCVQAGQTYRCINAILTPQVWTPANWTAVYLGDELERIAQSGGGGGGGGDVYPYDSNPAALGTASPGSSDDYARGDHVHPKPTPEDIGAGTYSKPSGGIPKTDLASGVQDSLDAADTAYQKPSGGIPASDLASAVQTSLGKADSALQSVPSTYRTASAQDVIDEGKADKVTEVTISTAGAVSQALDAGKIYHFTGAVSSLSLTLNAATSGQLAQYHFDFESGSTATTVTLTGVTWPDGSFTPEANKHYEVDILNGYGVYLSW